MIEQVPPLLPHGGRAPEEAALLERCKQFGESLLRDYEATEVTWWTTMDGDRQVSLRLSVTMPDSTYFKVSISPIMVHELLTDAPLDDFFEHMEREMTLKYDEWKRGVYAPRAPDLLEHVIAFREWNVDWVKGTLGPIGAVAPPWTGPTWQEAKCHGGSRHGGVAPYGHSAPHPDCHCGLYGLHNLPAEAPASQDSARPQRVWGAIQAMGRIEVHSNGIRAEYARPVMLITPGTTTYHVAGKLLTKAEFDRLPRALRSAANPMKPLADEAIRDLARRLGLDVVAWDYAVTKANEYGKIVPLALRP